MKSLRATSLWAIIKDQNYIIFKLEHWQLFEKTYSFMRRPTLIKLLRCIARSFLNIYQDIIDVRNIQFIMRKKIVFLGHSSNSIEVIGPLVSLFGENAVYVETMERLRSQEKRLPQSIISLLSLMMLPVFGYHTLRATRDERKKISWFLPAIYASYGTYLYWKIVMTITKPVALFVANDHSFETRTPVLLAHKKGIPIFYLQHAPVTKYFPSLIFDIAFLEGQNSLQCYHTQESDNVILVGNMKFERVRHLRNISTQVKIVGIAGSSFLTQEVLTQTLNLIKHQFQDLKIIFRPHPDAVHKNWSVLPDIEFSDVRKEDTFTFLSRIDLVIGGESGILAEAALMNIYPIMYLKENPDVIAFDSYGFIKHGVCDLAKNEEELLRILGRMIVKKEDSYSRVSYYYANWEKPFADKPFEKIFEIVSNHLGHRRVVHT